MSWLLTDLRGECAEPGYAVGYVRGLGARAGEADILVARTLEPAEIPELFGCLAVVLEEGGLTCHAAIAAQELGIPMLVGVPGATVALPAGSRVFVDTERRRVLRATPDAACFVCDPAATVQIWTGARLRVIEDMFPVVPDHYLIVPHRHITDPAELDGEDWAEVGVALDSVRMRGPTEHGSRDANLALNIGWAAGQTMPHLHWHVMLRRSGDDPDPRGGVRRLVAAPYRPYPPT